MSLNEIHHPMQLTNWILVELALLLIGLTKISFTISGFNHTSVIESPLREDAAICSSLAKTGRKGYLPPPHFHYPFLLFSTSGTRDKQHYTEAISFYYWTWGGGGL
jgi:hypothetical protein